jgi:hypothetical protein
VSVKSGKPPINEDTPLEIDRPPARQASKERPDSPPLAPSPVAQKRKLEDKPSMVLIVILGHVVLTSCIEETKEVKPVRSRKGASLANPNKKARKVQSIEFASDDDD